MPQARSTGAGAAEVARVAIPGLVAFVVMCKVRHERAKDIHTAAYARAAAAASWLHRRARLSPALPATARLVPA